MLLERRIEGKKLYEEAGKLIRDAEMEWNPAIGEYSASIDSSDWKNFLEGVKDYLKGFKEKCQAILYDPVNVCSGNYINENDDIHIGGRYPIVFHRFYNAQSEKNGVMGKGWTHSYEIFLKAEDRRIRIFYADGSEGIYIKEKEVFIELHGEPGVLIKEESGYRITYDSGKYKSFNDEGFMTAEGDAEGDSSVLVYETDDNGRKMLRKVISKNGNYIVFDYYQNGKLENQKRIWN